MFRSSCILPPEKPPHCLALKIFIVPLRWILRDSMEIMRNFTIYMQKCWLRLITRKVFLSLNIKLNTGDVWKSKGSAPRIHTVGISWNVVISFSTVREHPLVLPVDRRLGGPMCVWKPWRRQYSVLSEPSHSIWHWSKACTETATQETGSVSPSFRNFCEVSRNV